jgi:hypothetical protein
MVNVVKGGGRAGGQVMSTLFYYLRHKDLLSLGIAPLKISNFRNFELKEFRTFRILAPYEFCTVRNRNFEP